MVRQAYFDQMYADLQHRIALNKQLEETLRNRGDVVTAHKVYKQIKRLEQELSELCERFSTVEVKSDAEPGFNAEGTI